MIKCATCDKEFPSPSAFNQHNKDVHLPTEKEKSCEHCGKIFTMVSTRKRHEIKCPQKSETLWVPPANVDKTVVNNRHKRITTNMSKKGEELVKLFQDWLKNGGYSKILVLKKKKGLSQKSSESYAAHLRTVFTFIHESTIKEEIEFFITPSMIKSYLDYSNNSNYTQKTILNRLFAIERFVGFFSEKRTDEQVKLLSPLQYSNSYWLKLIDSSMEFIRAQIAILAPIASKETRKRNSREVLEESNKWISAQSLFEKHKELYPKFHHLAEKAK